MSMIEQVERFEKAQRELAQHESTLTELQKQIAESREEVRVARAELAQTLGFGGGSTKPAAPKKLPAKAKPATNGHSNGHVASMTGTQRVLHFAVQMPRSTAKQVAARAHTDLSTTYRGIKKGLRAGVIRKIEVGLFAGRQ
jgi:hypothetical protein